MIVWVDVIVASYALGEIRESQRAEYVKRLWQRANKCLVIVEPGSPRGAKIIDDMRAVVLSRYGQQELHTCCKHDYVCLGLILSTGSMLLVIQRAATTVVATRC